MSRRFRLQTLLQLREKAAQDATVRLGQCQRAVQEAEHHLTQAREAVLQCVPATRALPEQVQAAAVQRDALRDRAEELSGQLVQRRSELVTATQDWHSRRADLKAVENLRQRHLVALAEDDAHREQRLADELAAVGHRHTSEGDVR